MESTTENRTNPPIVQKNKKLPNNMGPQRTPNKPHIGEILEYVPSARPA